MEDELRNELIELSSDLIETMADQLLAEGLLRDIPVLNTAISVAKLTKTIRDRLFLEKVRRFLLSTSSISDEEKRKFYEKLRQDQEERKKVGEVVALILDRMDDLDKPEILAKMFVA